MSTLKANTISNVAGSQSISTDRVAQGTAAAWVNFNGTGTVAIRASYNVTSITDNNTGDYTVNFTNALPDANYSSLATCEDNTKVSQYSAATHLAGSLRTRVRNLSGTDTDVAIVTVAIFR